MTAGRGRAVFAALLLVHALGVATRAHAGQQQAASTATPAVASPAALEAEARLRTLREGDVDLAVPESPAFVAIGLSPDTVIRPVTPREFATALLNGVDRNGHPQTGVALDVVPYLVWAGNALRSPTTAPVAPPGSSRVPRRRLPRRRARVSRTRRSSSRWGSTRR